LGTDICEQIDTKHTSAVWKPSFRNAQRTEKPKIITGKKSRFYANFCYKNNIFSAGFVQGIKELVKMCCILCTKRIK